MQSGEERPLVDLPEEIIFTEILVRLPVDSLLIFSCVCKSWRDLIRSPYFVDKHLKKNIKSDPTIFFWCHGKIQNDIETEDMLFTPKYEDGPLCRLGKPLSYMRVIGSCNGIVFFEEILTRGVHLCNPCTGEERQLPCHNLQYKFGYPRMAFGLGFDASTEDYKVVAIGCGESKRKNHAKIYKLNTNCWSEVISVDLKCVDINTITIHNLKGVFVNGFYHWWTSENTMLTFDFKDEICGTMHFFSFECMGVVDDSLAICFSNRKKARTFDVWVMTEYGNNKSWMKKFSTQLPVVFNLSNCWAVHDSSQLMLLGHRRGTTYVEACLVDLKFRAKPLLEVYNGKFLSGVSFRPSLVSLCT